MVNANSKVHLEGEQAFQQFLLRRAEEYGFSETKKAAWVRTMLDTSRGESTVQALLAEFNLGNSSRDRALDVGCGFGSFLIAFHQHFSCVCGIEILAERVEWVKQRAPYAEAVCASATQLPWPDSWFDLVTCTDVFEHVAYPEQQAVAAEIARVLKPGGHGFISVPNRFQIWDEHNYVYFGTWLPDPIRERYTNLFSNNDRFLLCWERTGSGWKTLFRQQGLDVRVKRLGRRFLPANRYELYLTKPIDS